MRAAWADGVSGGAIGRELGRSASAVIGKASRLNLAPRPSPIKPPKLRQDAAPAPRTPSLGERVTTVRLPPAVAPKVLPAPTPVAAQPAVTRATPAPERTRRVTACCWPIGEPGSAGFRFCETVALPGCPYCDEHRRRAYVSGPSRQHEDAA